ncbi:ParB/RepB/Spo0J family partition protein [Streptomyces sp. SDr-06]|uniref:ParB/RepB/Spo0J family partition protein n=1 Tax=Streptomyces sp. SDr-06 TaxID=2267702 RepID=UPI000DEA235D|nr:ParB/RepB/Spo0J family partition protein [Streptomyces sp. SDr-06]RCH65521.1 ParB/RepB/Spo0J family partition protein [Streptomyces sp. SDr-06]
MAGQRVSLAGLATETVESVPGRSRPTLVHLPPDQVVATPLNPRQDFSEESLRELGESMRQGQLQPCVGVTRAAYVKLFPEHAEQLPQCRVVMAAGERRWRAAQQAGLPTLDVHLREDIAESRVRFLAAVLAENVERSNFNYIEEAVGLQRMLELTFNQQVEAAAALGKSKQWFNQRIGLLRLTQPMRDLVTSGKLTAFRDMRRYSALPAEEQLAAWEADQRKKNEPKSNPAVEVSTAEQRGHESGMVAGGAVSGYTAVYPPAVPEPVSPAVPSTGEQERGSAGGEMRSAPGESGATAPGYTAVYPEQTAVRPGPEGSSGVLPEPRGEGETSGPAALTKKPPVKMPWADPAAVAQIVIAKMTSADRSRLCELLAAQEERERKGSAQLPTT